MINEILGVGKGEETSDTLWSATDGYCSAAQAIKQYASGWERKNLRADFAFVVGRAMRDWNSWDKEHDLTPLVDHFLKASGIKLHLARAMIAAVMGDDAIIKHVDLQRNYDRDHNKWNKTCHVRPAMQDKQLQVLRKLVKAGAPVDVTFKDELLLRAMEYELFPPGAYPGHYDHDARNKEKEAFFDTSSRTEECRISLMDKAMLTGCYEAARFLFEQGAHVTPTGVYHILDQRGGMYGRCFDLIDEEVYPLQTDHYDPEMLNLLREDGVDVEQMLLKVYIAHRTEQHDKRRAEEPGPSPLFSAFDNLRAHNVSFSGKDIPEFLGKFGPQQKEDVGCVAGLIGLMDPERCAPEDAQAIVKFLSEHSWYMHPGAFAHIWELSRQEKKGHLIPGERNALGVIGFWLTVAYIGQSSGYMRANLKAEPRKADAFVKLLHQGGYEWKSAGAQLRQHSLYTARDVQDYTREFYQYVVLPAAMMRVNKDLDDIPDELADYLMKGLEKRLVPATFSVIAEQKSICDVVAASERWHDRRANFILARVHEEGAAPIGIRDHAFMGEWHLLLPAKSIKSEKKPRQPAMLITNLGSAPELSDEAKVMSHCVDGYVQKCKEGKVHILSIQNPSKHGVRSTVELSIGKNGELSVVQHRGHKNTKPPVACQRALEWLLEEIKKGKIVLNTERLGAIEGGHDLPALRSTIGYDPNAATLERAFDVFKRPEFHAVRRDETGAVMIDVEASRRLGMQVPLLRRHGYLISGDYHRMHAAEFITQSGLGDKIDAALKEMGIEMKPRIEPRPVLAMTPDGFEIS